MTQICDHGFVLTKSYAGFRKHIQLNAAFVLWRGAIQLLLGEKGYHKHEDAPSSDWPTPRWFIYS
jgi:hypothetical protein